MSPRTVKIHTVASGVQTQALHAFSNVICQSGFLKLILLTPAEGSMSHSPGLKQNATWELLWPNWAEIQKLHIDLWRKYIDCPSGFGSQLTNIWIWTHSHAPHFFKFTQAETVFKMVSNNAHWAESWYQLGNPKGYFLKSLSVSLIHSLHSTKHHFPQPCGDLWVNTS